MILGQLVNVPRSFRNCPDDRFFRSGGILLELVYLDQKCTGADKQGLTIFRFGTLVEAGP